MAKTKQSQNPETEATVGVEQFAPKIVRFVTLPLFKIEEGKGPIYVRFDSPVFLGKSSQTGEPGRPPKEPPMLANVTRLPGGEAGQIILGKALLGTIDDHYPDEKYVGKAFLIEITGKKKNGSGNQYNSYRVCEIEL